MEEEKKCECPVCQCPVCHGTGVVTETEIHAYRKHDKEIPREKGCSFCNETGFENKKLMLEENKVITIIRIDESPEEIAFYAHSGECRYCSGIVKMFRDDKTMKLQPNNCRCLKCGQPYFVKIEDTVEEFELEQWKQKGNIS